MGSGVIDAIDAVVGVELETHIQLASSLIVGYLQNSGYTPGDSTTDDRVKLATIGALWEMLASIPEVSIALPANWEAHPARIAYVGILNGDLPVSHTVTEKDAIGGSQLTEHREGVTGAVRQRTSREELGGF